MEKDILSDQINSLFAKEKWADARTLLEPELKKSPDSHWLLDRISVTYYEQKEYQKALALIKKALVKAPQCPLVLWDYAGTCAALGKTEEAVQKYSKLIDMYPLGFHQDECGEDEIWAASLVTDCFFRLGVCFQTLKKNELAAACFDSYLNIRKKDKTIQSNYTTADARKRRAMISSMERTNGHHSIKGVVASCNSILPEVKRAHDMLAGCR